MTGFTLNELVPTWAVATEILKGDLSGHIFHGNQWRDATGNQVEQHEKIAQAVAKMQVENRAVYTLNPKVFAKIEKMFDPLIDHHQEQLVIARKRGDEVGQTLHEAALRANRLARAAYLPAKVTASHDKGLCTDERERAQAATKAADDYTAAVGAPTMRAIAIAGEAARTPGIENPFEDPGYLAHQDQLKADFIVSQFRAEQRARENQ